MSAWLLPDHIADVLPSEARHIEDLRRDLLDVARRHGYELVIPPMVEHLQALLTGAGTERALDTFQLVDQLSGKTLGVRPDITPQVARIDAHLLNRQGVTRLCYCGPVLHTRVQRARASREPLQLGAEIYGHAGLEADLEALDLAQAFMGEAGLQGVRFDLGDARIFPAILSQSGLEAKAQAELREAVACKSLPTAVPSAGRLSQPVQSALAFLVQAYGDIQLLDEAEQALAGFPQALAAIQDLRWLAGHLGHLPLSFDLADMSGYAYYTGVRFAAYTPGCSDAVLRGGRYDEVGAAFGRKRPAVGFSLDLKTWVQHVPALPLGAAIRAPWSEDTELRSVIARLREQGHTVVCVLPGHESEVDEFDCDRELIRVNDRWVVQSLSI
ncbi:MAG: ATP phosphoribosyltransferase regulatory subunit [Betaproteobacteria bacterium]|jgi:ATP phosphoribosyltransferase regulatory subunit|nr:ATP phosphoribosyltransferase regulatory subunit [Betaproteobacteria bacterium]NBP43809.1 ATP phosphoribosyltransferase regulatory subunit [Betaproteobacteria bacterium]